MGCYFSSKVSGLARPSCKTAFASPHSAQNEACTNKDLPAVGWSQDDMILKAIQDVHHIISRYIQWRQADISFLSLGETTNLKMFEVG